MSTPSHQRTHAANAGLGIRLTPSTPSIRNQRSPNRLRSLYEPELNLQRIIGTTVSSPPAFDSLRLSPVFAYTAGAAAVVVAIDQDSKYSQRFFRARPTAAPFNAFQAGAFAPSTPTHIPSDGRNRPFISKDSSFQYSPSFSHTNTDWADSPTSKTWTSRERIKAASCLSLSQDGRFLAVGETGYAPRLLVYPLQDASSGVLPVAILNEHTYGVKAVAFSPNHKYLASLGSPNDGFLYVWTINQRTGAAKLHSSNKCTSFVKQMTWVGQNVVTVGTRHIKVWKVEEPRNASPTKPRFALDGTPQPVPTPPLLKTLAGRNCLLGPLVEATFTCVAAVSDMRALICTEKGDICLLDGVESPKLNKVAGIVNSISCITIDKELNRVRVGGRSGMCTSFDLSSLLDTTIPLSLPRPSGLEPEHECGHLCAMGYAGKRLVVIDTNHRIGIQTSNVTCPDSFVGPIERDCVRPRHDSPGEVDARLWENLFPAHADAAMGVNPLPGKNCFGAEFLTWSASGTIVFWDLSGNVKASLLVNIEQMERHDESPSNRCQVVKVSRNADLLLAGDRHGVLQVVAASDGTCTFDARAHSSEVLDMALFEGEDEALVASCSRDRTVQLYRLSTEERSLALLQTFDEHCASVGSVIFAGNGDKLVSSSSDRTIHIRQLISGEGAKGVVGAVPFRIISLKASPVSLNLSYEDRTDLITVSMLDRTIATYEMGSGRLIHTFRTTDGDGADAVVLDALVMGRPDTMPGRPTILAGVSSTDKSVRVYDGSTGTFLDREFGHVAAITGLALLEDLETDQKTLISTGSDGTIMMWGLSPSGTDSADGTDTSSSMYECEPNKEITSVRPPLRKVLSRLEMAELQKASPLSTAIGGSSPPHGVRRKTSKFTVSSQSPTLPPPISMVSSKSVQASSDDMTARRNSPRNRSRSPPSPKSRVRRRPSAPLLSTRSRTKSSGNLRDLSNLNVATEQVVLRLRAFRKKLLSSESVKDNVLKELDQELRLTTIALGEKSRKSQAFDNTVLTGLLGEYSDKLVSMFDEKLRLSR